MTSAAFLALWATVGAIVGRVAVVHSGRFITSARPEVSAAKVVAILLTACAFYTLAWRFGYQFDLLPYSVFAAVGIALGLIDVVEQRLPSELVYASAALIGGLLATAAILYSRGPDLLRALVGLAVLVTLYFVLALASGGGLGAGDVKLGGLLGLTLAWSSWPTLIAATFLGWLAAALLWVTLRVMRWRERDSLLPMGPFLVLGALLTIVVFPAVP